MKEFCKCSHSKKSHVNDFDNTRCCSAWQNEKGINMCDCMAYDKELEGAEMREGKK